MMVFADTLKSHRDTEQGKANIKELLHMVSDKLNREDPTVPENDLTSKSTVELEKKMSTQPEDAL